MGCLVERLCLEIPHQLLQARICGCDEVDSRQCGQGLPPLGQILHHCIAAQSRSASGMACCYETCHKGVTVVMHEMAEPGDELKVVVLWGCYSRQGFGRKVWPHSSHTKQTQWSVLCAARARLLVRMAARQQKRVCCATLGRCWNKTLSAVVACRNLLLNMQGSVCSEQDKSDASHAHETP